MQIQQVATGTPLEVASSPSTMEEQMAVNEPSKFPFRLRNENRDDRSTLFAVLAGVALIGLGLLVWSASDNRPVDQPRVEAPATNPNQ